MRRTAAWVLVGAVGMLVDRAAVAQTAAAPGPYVIDVRGTTAGLPNDPGFFPVIPADALIPARGFGLDLGGHVYVLRLGVSRVGVGVNVIRTWASASTEPSLMSVSSSMERPDVRGTFTAIAPQISFNFGSAAGWSHLSAGLGQAQIEMRAVQPTAPEARRTSGRLTAINVGGGARWFLRSRLALGFDVRFHRLAARAASTTRSGTPSTTVMSASAGISVR